MKKEKTSDRLKKIMAQCNLKQVDILNLAKPYCEKYNVKLGKSDLSQYVSGKVEPSQNKLTVLSLALKVSETWLMGYDVDDDNLVRIDSLSNLDKELLTLMYSLDENQKKQLLAQLKTFFTSKDN